MKKKLLIVLLVCLLLAAAAMLWSEQRHQATYITIHGVEYRRDAEHLSFSIRVPDEPEAYAQLTQVRSIDLLDARVSIGEYEALRAALPQARIDWNIPFQGTYYPQDTRELTVAELSPEDLDTLSYFPELRAVNADGCRDYTMITALMERYPQLEVSYTVTIGGKTYPHTATELFLQDADIAELEQLLPFLPRMGYVSFDGTLPPAEALIALTERFPEIRFYWQVRVHGKLADVYTTQLDFSGFPMADTDELEKAVAYLPALEKVLMLECGLSDAQMEQLNQRFGDPLFVWNVKLGRGITVRSDITVFAPVLLGMQVWDGDLDNLRYCTELVVVDLGHMKISHCEFLSTLTKLEYLVLADTYISDLTPLSNLKNLKFLEIFMSPIRDYTPLVQCTALEDLNLCYTTGDPTPLCRMTWLKRLWCISGYMTNDQKANLLSSLPDTQIVFPTFGSTSDGWRTGYLYYQMRDLMGMPYLTE